MIRIRCHYAEVTLNLGKRSRSISTLIKDMDDGERNKLGCKPLRSS